MIDFLKKHEKKIIINVLLGFWVVVISFVIAIVQIPRDFRNGVYNRVDEKVAEQGRYSAAQADAYREELLKEIEKGKGVFRFRSMYERTDDDLFLR